MRPKLPGRFRYDARGLDFAPRNALHGLWCRATDVSRGFGSESMARDQSRCDSWPFLRRWRPAPPCLLTANSRPEVLQLELNYPALDVSEVQLAGTELEDSGGIPQLQIAAAALLRPFELGEDGIFGRGHEDAHAQQIAFRSSAHFLHGKRARSADDEIGLPGGRHVDDIELTPPAKCVESRRRVHVVLGRRKIGE